MNSIDSNHLVSESPHWLETRSSALTQRFIAQANSKSAHVLAEFEPLTSTITQEIIARLDMNRQIPAYNQEDFSYSLKDIEGHEKPLFFRQYQDQPPVLIFDENSEPAALLCCDSNQLLVHRLECDPKQVYLPIVLDPSGNERFSLHIKDMFTGEYLAVNLAAEAIAPQLAWLDEHRFIYLALDSRNRPYQARLYNLHQQQCQLLHNEPDPCISLNLRRASSGQYIFLTADELQESSVVYHLRCDAVNPTFNLLRQRKAKQQDLL
ncbi:hypothetical protein N9E78_00225, partial [bacterium]|nr:hypothetical protein [bacterium]